ncbi:hypothetical protein ADZ37_05920 [Pannonibacter phragmitetus]|uniref:hypothetical protein n=1 Tax=Pannonibacter TaxID=227873 RepID=UPI00067D713D|nr:hypothetical protein [Pannonibacter phragmitetus]KND19995.1 hypothetical protein ADZ37_05920 [Pannonibacter phragmitetus]MBA4205515.1 hypothetical protein [Polymorphum sp.]
MSALGFVGGLAGAVAIGIYGLIAFVFLTAAMLELAERGRTSRLELFLALAGALLWPVSLVVASAAAIHAVRRARRRRQANTARMPSGGREGPEKPVSDKPAIALVERDTASRGAHSEAPPHPKPSAQAGGRDAEPGPAASVSTSASSTPSVQPSAIGGPVVRTLAPLQMQPQPPFGMPGPDSRSRIILSPRQLLGAVRLGEPRSSASRLRLRQTSLSKPPKGKPG